MATTISSNADSGFCEPSWSTQHSKSTSSSTRHQFQPDDAQLKDISSSKASNSAEQIQPAVPRPSTLPSCSSLEAQRPPVSVASVGSQQVRFSTLPSGSPRPDPQLESTARNSHSYQRPRPSPNPMLSSYRVDADHIQRLPTIANPSMFNQYVDFAGLRARHDVAHQHNVHDKKVAPSLSKPYGDNISPSFYQEPRLPPDGTPEASPKERVLQSTHLGQEGVKDTHARYHARYHSGSESSNSKEVIHQESSDDSTVSSENEDKKTVELRKDNIDKEKKLLQPQRLRASRRIAPSSSTATGSSNPTRSSRSTGIRRSSYSSQNTSVDSVDEGESPKHITLVSTKEDNISIDSVPITTNDNETNTTVSMMIVTGAAIVRFGGSETHLAAGTECTLVKRSKNHQKDAPKNISEEPLISLDSSAENDTGAESSLSMPFDSGGDPKGSDSYAFLDNNEINEKELREIIRKGKRIQSSIPENASNLDDSQGPSSESSGTPLSISKQGLLRNVYAVSGKHPEITKLLPEIEEMETTKLGQCRLPGKRVTFDPYSSEDLDIFDDCIGEGNGNFMKSVEIISKVINPKQIDDTPPNTAGEWSTQQTETIPCIFDSFLNSESSEYSFTSRPDLLSDQEQVHEYNLYDCPKTFNGVELLVQNTHEHGTPSNLPSLSFGDENILNSPNLKFTESNARVKLSSETRDTATNENALLGAMSDIQSPTIREDASTPMSIQSDLEVMHSLPDSDGYDMEYGYHHTEKDLGTLSEGGLIHSDQQNIPGETPYLAWEQSSILPLHHRLNTWIFGLGTRVRRFLRPKLPVGSQRIEWICGCGEALYADFRNKDKDTIRRMKTMLHTVYAPALSPTTQSPSQLQIPANSFLTPNHTRRSSSSTSIFSGAGSQSSTRYGISSTTDLSSLSSSNMSTPQFLELCVNTGEHLKELGEIDLTSATCDGDLFGAVQERYLQIRGFRSKLWFLKPARISYVRFSVEQRHRIGILQKPLAVPPKSEVDSKRWIYNPCPLDGDPPIAEHLFLHYLQCSQRSRNLFWLHRMPRKLSTRILEDGIASAAFGWGVHIDEGPDYRFFLWFNFICLFMSGVFATMWTIYKHDFQGAFGFACWLIATLNTFMLALMYRWRHL
ncbi:hypothetical protein BP6252_11100 [Coleophoma cylindrospora]|uniref:Uncharacterized protein n=1 Tax=Coleophoma cylindrospora TaxID=1849047 RepID=A0A3D8QP25_9HELO|nr:hypothetical protein BP6252_11100 [Coleophoma cylindrospora]